MDDKIKSNQAKASNPQSPQDKSKIAICALRDELKLSKHQNGREVYWTLYDPTNGKFFRIDKITFIVLSCYEGNTVQDVLDKVNSKYALDLELDDIIRVNNFIKNNSLCVANAQTKEKLLKAFRIQQSMLKKVTNQYLFFKLPLLNPNGILKFLYPKLSFFFKPWFWYVFLGLALLSVFLIVRRWDIFIHSITNFTRLDGLVAYISVIVLSKVVHEFAHALTLFHYGKKVNTMGVAILMFMPMLYTDASESWNIDDPKKRLKVAAAGILSEILLATVASLLWLVLDDGLVKNACFVLATTNWVTTIFFNMNPLMRFDGYFICSDLFKMENLQPRAINQLKKYVAKVFFSISINDIEVFYRKKRTILIIFGLATIIYRISVIMGIILLVYYFFFKILGILLLFQQIYKSILMPIIRGIKWLYARKAQLKLTKTFYASAVVLFIFLTSGVFPISSRMYLQGQLVAVDSSTVYVPYSGFVEEAISPDTKYVNKGQVIAKLRSYEIEKDLNNARLKFADIQQQINVLGFNQSLQENRLVLLEERERTKMAISTAEAKIAKLLITAPQAGHIDLCEEGKITGQYLTQNTPLGIISNNKSAKVIAYVPEIDRERIKVGDIAVFYPSYSSLNAIEAKVSRIDDYVATQYPNKAFDAKYGGSFTIVGDDNRSVEGNYCIEFELLNQDDSLFKAQRDGTILVYGKSQSVYVKLFKNIYSLLIKELVF